MTFANECRKVADQVDLGTATAHKRGRSTRWPYVPVIASASQRYGTSTHQVRGRAYATREEAVAMAQRVIDRQRQRLAEQLTEPRQRALRAQYGLPREVPPDYEPRHGGVEDQCFPE